MPNLGLPDILVFPESSSSFAQHPRSLNCPPPIVLEFYFARPSPIAEKLYHAETQISRLLDMICDIARCQSHSELPLGLVSSCFIQSAVSDSRDKTT